MGAAAVASPPAWTTRPLDAGVPPAPCRTASPAHSASSRSTEHSARRLLLSPSLARSTATPLPPLRFLREPRASPPLCFPPESSSPAKSLAIVHLRPIHCTRSIISTSQSDPSFFP